MKISAVIITKNEERIIEACLKAVQQVADEIIVIDSMSEDRTEEICAQHEVVFVKKPFEGYSKTKNYGNSLASGDYILSVDADEVLSEELIASILEEKKKGFPNVAYRLKRLTNYCGHWIRHCGWYPDAKIRLWKRGAAEWTGDIHETLSFISEISVEWLRGDLLHYSFYSVEQHIRQMNGYTTLMAREAFQKGKQAPIWKILLSPGFKFFKTFFLKRGFLDGYYGFVVCALSAVYVFLKNIKLRLLVNSEQQKNFS
ncbi:MAG: glycosyltransferase family 2 protein [Cytophagales bacterium]|nr:glycosyltransferase family 2 protein [Cytophagales bacterium]